MLKNFFFCTYKKTNWVEIVLPLGPKFLWLWRSPELYWRQIAAIVPKFPSPRAHLKCAWTHFLSCSPNFDHIVSKPNQPKKETKKNQFSSNSHFLKIHIPDLEHWQNPLYSSHSTFGWPATNFAKLLLRLEPNGSIQCTFAKFAPKILQQ